MRGLKWKLLLSLIIFTAIIVTAIMWINRQTLLNAIEREEFNNRQNIEGAILHDMQTVDKAHLYFDTSIAETMQKELSAWREYYKENPDIESWDISEIKERTGMEFYIIDKKSVIVRTTYEPSMDFDFKECCGRFVELLDERRLSDKFYSDGLDNSAATKDLWKYSYWSTPDHQYVLEMGLQVDNTELYKSFNFFNSSERLIDEYPDLQEIRIINDEGYFLQSKDENDSVHMMEARWRAAYNEALATLKQIEFQSTYGDVEETHRFVPYTAEVQRGNSTTRIIYMKFNNTTKLQTLDNYSKQFFVTLLVAILISLGVLFIELKILMSTFKLATFDALTDIYNRASYVQHMDSLISNSKRFPLGLLLIDLDNFKAINDQYGHSEGDKVLKEIARILKKFDKKTHFPVRFGGDEFALVVEKATADQLENISREIITAVKMLSKESQREHWGELSVSIGGTIQQEPMEEEAKLFERADAALYASKNNGKDQYTKG